MNQFDWFIKVLNVVGFVSDRVRNQKLDSKLNEIEQKTNESNNLLQNNLSDQKYREDTWLLSFSAAFIILFLWWAVGNCYGKEKQVFQMPTTYLTAVGTIIWVRTKRSQLKT
jgi:hypothetical protein